jgi:DNA polymerase I
MPNYLTHDDTYWVFDIETDDFNATKIHCCSFINVETGTEHLAVGESETREFIEAHPEAVWVGHNAIPFDARVVSRLLGADFSTRNVVDTCVLSRLFDPKLEGGHSLESWGVRTKMPKGDFKDFSRYTPEMGSYCLQDARITRKVYLKLSKRMAKLKFSELSCEIEHKIREVMDGQKENGFYFDINMAKDLRDKLRGVAEECGGRIGKLFPPVLKEVARYKFRTRKNGKPTHHFLRHRETYPELRIIGDEYSCFALVSFNIGSVPQRVEKLLSLGWEPKEFTDKGNPKVDEDSLVEFANSSGIPEVQAIADWLVATGRANMIDNWLNNVDKDKSVIRGYVDSCGASTRRMTHSAPNTANIPGNDVAYGHESRELWRARPGRLLCGVDAKALEMRMFGHYLNNDEAAKMYVEGDPHTYNAEMLEVERKPMKGIFYAFLYGASDGKIGRTAGIKKNPAKWGAWARERLISRTPGLGDLVRTVEQEQARGFIKTLDGGYVRCPSPHAALNYKLQSGGAIAMKVVAINLAKAIREQGLDALLVGNIHDELQYDCAPNEAEKIGKLALDIFLSSGRELNLRVPLEGDYKIGTSWAQTH